MGGITAYSVTLYRLFCQVTGAGGTTQRAAASTASTAHTVRVRFDTNVAPGLPWRFDPPDAPVTLRLGQDTLVFFHAANRGREEIVGRATFNVTPEKAGLYFKKVQCFCFDEERLGAGESAELPVTFYVDPALATDPNTADVREITLSYTFFRTQKPSAPRALARFAAPDPTRGATLFAQGCAACHAADHPGIGPALGGVVGRRAGATGFAYSPALKGSALIWDQATLLRWLENPAALVPGTAMPARVPEEAARRDIVAYLRTLGPRPAGTGS